MAPIRSTSARASAGRLSSTARALRTAARTSGGVASRPSTWTVANLVGARHHHGAPAPGLVEPRAHLGDHRRHRVEHRVDRRPATHRALPIGGHEHRHDLRAGRPVARDPDLDRRIEPDPRLGVAPLLPRLARLPLPSLHLACRTSSRVSRSPSRIAAVSCRSARSRQHAADQANASVRSASRTGAPSSRARCRLPSARSRACSSFSAEHLLFRRRPPRRSAPSLARVVEPGPRRLAPPAPRRSRSLPGT